MVFKSLSSLEMSKISPLYSWRVLGYKLKTTLPGVILESYLLPGDDFNFC